ncbi:hypothetical protein TCAP_00868 [Tolypocladium capitatum]|uniref:Uncharacterized protein n=1 Tax=Tolypocladium capitatum TaxID=45235 RepID=A0A2K3QNV0_9HYPO|nr:hypothetical protein TCAP_00868 [Tolypocladium capitatum]
MTATMATHRQLRGHFKEEPGSDPGARMREGGWDVPVWSRRAESEGCSLISSLICPYVSVRRSGQTLLGRANWRPAEDGASKRSENRGRRPSCGKLSSVNISAVVRLRQRRRWAATNTHDATLDGGVFRDTRLCCSGGEARAGGDWRTSTQRATVPDPASHGTRPGPSGSLDNAVAVEHGGPGPRRRPTC